MFKNLLNFQAGFLWNKIIEWQFLMLIYHLRRCLIQHRAKQFQLSEEKRRGRVYFSGQLKEHKFSSKNKFSRDWRGERGKAVWEIWLTLMAFIPRLLFTSFSLVGSKRSLLFSSLTSCTRFLVAFIQAFFKFNMAQLCSISFVGRRIMISIWSATFFPCLKLKHLVLTNGDRFHFS